MYIYNPRGQKKRNRGKSNRFRAKLKAKNRRRVNRTGKRRLSAA